MAIASAIAEKPSAPSPIQGSGIASFFFIGLPILLVALCLAAKFGYVEIAAGPRASLIFVLLIALMLTGMPISIALGLTVLIFVFTLTEVPIHAVALKLLPGSSASRSWRSHSSSLPEPSSRTAGWPDG
jgi:C4-dicarboxylate transporter, DctM subunit